MNAFLPATLLNFLSSGLISVLILLSFVGSIHGVAANMQDSHIVVSDFELQQPYYIHFRINTHWKDIKPLYPLASYELNSTTTILLQR